MGDKVIILDTTAEANYEKISFKKELQRLNSEAEEAVRSGCVHIILIDKKLSKHRISIPMILATSSVHHHLIKKNLRTYVSLNIQSAECLDIHYFAVLLAPKIYFCELTNN